MVDAVVDAAAGKADVGGVTIANGRCETGGRAGDSIRAIV